MDGCARIFLIQNPKNGEKYEIIASMMLFENNSDACQLQVKDHLQQLRIQHVIAEQNIIDFQKGIKTLLHNVEELDPQIHPSSKPIEQDELSLRRNCEVLGVVSRSDWENSLTEVLIK